MKLSVKQQKELNLFFKGQIIAPYWLKEWCEIYYAGEIPYTTITGDESNLDEFISDRADEIEAYFKDEQRREIKPVPSRKTS